MMRSKLTGSILGVALSLVLVWMVSGQVATAKEPPKVIEIKKCDKTKGPVKFEHAKHHERVKTLGKDCTTCHHGGDPKKGPKDDKGCFACHMKETKGLGTCFDKSKKKNPFHVMCIGCHKKLKEENKKDMTKGPTACKKCHTKAKGDDKEGK